MTAMQQIEQLCIEARAHGMTYGEYVEKFGELHPKPETSQYKELGYFVGVKKKCRKARVRYKLICEICGVEWEAGRKDAQYCPKCRIKRARMLSRENKRAKTRQRREGANA